VSFKGLAIYGARNSDTLNGEMAIMKILFTEIYLQLQANINSLKESFWCILYCVLKLLFTVNSIV